MEILTTDGKLNLVYRIWLKLRDKVNKLGPEKDKNFGGKYFAIQQLLEKRDFRRAKKILSQDFDVNYKRESTSIDIDKETLLFNVVRQANKEGVELLLNSGINPLIGNALGYLPIQQVRWREKDGIEIGNLLLSKMNIRSKQSI